MASVMSLPGGRNETIFDMRDFLSLVEEFMGVEASCWLEEWISENDEEAGYIDDLEKETDGLRSHHRQIMEELRTHVEIIARLIRDKEIDRKALSAAVGSIGCITMREAGR